MAKKLGSAGSKTARMKQNARANEKLEIAKKICEKYATGEFTIESCCHNAGIEKSTFHYWKIENPEIMAMFNDAKKKHNAIRKTGLKEKAETGLEQLILGFWITETDTEEMFSKTGQLVGKKVKTKNRFIQPQTAAVIFALKNTDPENWADQIQLDVTGDEQIFQIGGQTIRFT